MTPQPWQLAKKVQLALIGSWPRAFQRTIYELSCALPLSPPKVCTKHDFAVLPVKSNCRRKQSTTKFLCVKTSSGKVVATSFLYQTVHRWIAGDISIYLKFALKVTHPLRKCSFRQILLNGASAVRASEKSSIIANRKLTMRFPSSSRWTLCVTP